MHLDIWEFFVFNHKELIVPRDIMVAFSVNLSQYSCSKLQEKNVSVFEDLMAKSKFLPVIKSRKPFKIVTIDLSSAQNSTGGLSGNHHSRPHLTRQEAD